MITQVKIYLNDAQELQWFAQFQGIIANYRAGQAQNEIQAPGETTDPQAPADVPGIEPEGKVVGHIQPKEEPKVEYADLEKVVMAYLQKNGVPATRQKIADFGYPQLDKVPAEKWAELKALFEGWMA